MYFSIKNIFFFFGFFLFNIVFTYTRNRILNNYTRKFRIYISLWEEKNKAAALFSLLSHSSTILHFSEATSLSLFLSFKLVQNRKFYFFVLEQKDQFVRRLNEWIGNVERVQQMKSKKKKSIKELFFILIFPAPLWRKGNEFFSISKVYVLRGRI